jgi:hypothetical protein
MSLNTAEIKKRLSSVPSIKIDNQAQDIINGASKTELNNLDAEGVLRLYEALAMLPPRVFSSNDKAALSSLRKHTQFQPVSNSLNLAISLVRGARPSPFLRQLTPDLVTRIYAAEHRRLSMAERFGIDGATIGRGQLSQLAYMDVISSANFRDAFMEYINRVFIPALLTTELDVYQHHWDFKSYTPKIEPNYTAVYSNHNKEDFVVAAYLAIRIRAAIRPGRSTVDVVRFAAALYHGMRNMVTDAQDAVNNTTDWAPVEAELLRLRHVDEVAYVNEVVR